MQELLYLEVPTPDTARVREWLRDAYVSQPAQPKRGTANGCLLTDKLSIFAWSLQRTTYVKAFWWSDAPVPQWVGLVLQDLTAQLRSLFPLIYPQPPVLPAETSIFTGLAEQYPLTVKYFQKFPQGEYDLQRVYWWEQRWRQSVCNPTAPVTVIFQHDRPYSDAPIPFDLIYLGGALGAIHSAMMAKLGYRVCLVERLGFGRMNREWNISRSELETLVNFGLFTWDELNSIITAEYIDGFNKFFDGNNPPHLKAQILHTPTVLNVAIDTSKLLSLCEQKLRSYGAEIFDFHEFQELHIYPDRALVHAKSLKEGTMKYLSGRIAIDAMGSASLISQQLNGGKAFNSVCPTVGAVVEGFPEGVWDSRYGDVLFSHGDISRGRQLIWELFPGEGKELTIYLFHYHEIHPQNPGSLLEMYEDFFTILPEYRYCEMDKLTWKKPTFGYIPAFFALRGNSRQVASDRLLAIGDAGALQSPLVFTGFGSLVRNLPRLTTLLDFALKHDLLTQEDLNLINAYQSNIAVTWLFSKGMMVPTGKDLPPARINSILNTFFGILAEQPPEVSDRFIKDRIDWLMFNKLALIAAVKNPRLVQWIWSMAGAGDMGKWLYSYGSFSWQSLQKYLLQPFLPKLVEQAQGWLAQRNPRLYLRLLSYQYSLQLL
ncbi:MAG: flavin-dependent dehydrogenase [Pseudanabaenaceae cyanobacterium]